MKYKTLTIWSVASALALGMAAPSFADAVRHNLTPQKTMEIERDHMKGQKASDLIGRDVVNSAGKDIGEIEKIVVNEANNEVYAIVSVGGFLGMGEKDVAIPYQNLNVGDKNVILMSQDTSDALKQMPAYDEKGTTYKVLSSEKPKYR